MVEFVTWDQIQPIIYLIVIISGVLIFLKWRWSYALIQQKSEKYSARKEHSIESMIDKKLLELPSQLKKVQVELKHLKDTGATDTQMKSLKTKERMLELGVDYGDIGAEIAKPIIKRVMSIVKGVGQ